MKTYIYVYKYIYICCICCSLEIGIKKQNFKKRNKKIKRKLLTIMQALIIKALIDNTKLLTIRKRADHYRMGKWDSAVFVVY